MRILPVIAAAVAMALVAAAQTTAAPQSADKSAKTSAHTSAKTSPKTSAKKRVKKAVVAAAVKRTAPRRIVAPRPFISAATRAEAHEGVVEKVFRGAQFPVENAAALVPVSYTHLTLP